MGSVDKTDMLVSSAESIRKGVKWYYKKNPLYFLVLDLSILNAHSLYKVVMGNITPLPISTWLLSWEILEKYCKAQRKSGGGRRSNEGLPLKLVQRYFPSTVGPQTSKKKSSMRKCSVFKEQRKTGNKIHVPRLRRSTVCHTMICSISHTKTLLKKTFILWSFLFDCM